MRLKLLHQSLGETMICQFATNCIQGVRRKRPELGVWCPFPALWSKGPATKGIASGQNAVSGRGCMHGRLLTPPLPTDAGFNLGLVPSARVGYQGYGSLSGLPSPTFLTEGGACILLSLLLNSEHRAAQVPSPRSGQTDGRSSSEPLIDAPSLRGSTTAKPAGDRDPVVVVRDEARKRARLLA